MAPGPRQTNSPRAETDDNDHRWLVQIGEANQTIRDSRWKLPGLWLARTSVRIAILGAAAACVHGTYRFPADSYTQSLVANAAAGFLVFFAAAPILRAM